MLLPGFVFVASSLIVLLTIAAGGPSEPQALAVGLRRIVVPAHG
ncbi:hypothetical protein Pla52n_06700 [Stieleria varia]|uniref:Uncharacterized protein n=1 Tax=Stieleria varia TaxID=2528005 RepID=A0A5C6B9U1_9BACT|nr:hypothetical protein Pla52n_06700 [Stieleria varia]